MRAILLVCSLSLAGCAAAVGTSDRDTGGGGISAYEGHSARQQGAASGSGSSAAAREQGAVAGSGAADAPNNAHSASESNGGNTVGETPQPQGTPAGQ